MSRFPAAVSFYYDMYLLIGLRCELCGRTCTYDAAPGFDVQVVIDGLSGADFGPGGANLCNEGVYVDLPEGSAYTCMVCDRRLLTAPGWPTTMWTYDVPDERTTALRAIHHRAKKGTPWELMVLPSQLQKHMRDCNTPDPYELVCKAYAKESEAWLSAGYSSKQVAYYMHDFEEARKRAALRVDRQSVALPGWMGALLNEGRVTLKPIKVERLLKGFFGTGDDRRIIREILRRHPYKATARACFAALFHCAERTPSGYRTYAPGAAVPPLDHRTNHSAGNRVRNLLVQYLVLPTEARKALQTADDLSAERTLTYRADGWATGVKQRPLTPGSELEKAVKRCKAD